MQTERVGLSRRASSSSGSERDVQEFSGRLTMLEAVGDYAQRQCLDPGNRLVAVRAVAHDAGEGGYFRDPAAVLLALQFNRESHATNVPSGSAARGASRRDLECLSNRVAAGRLLT